MTWSFTFNRMWKADNAYAKVSGGAYDYFNDMGMPDSAEVDRQGRRPHREVHADSKPNAPFIANMAMDFASIHSG